MITAWKLCGSRKENHGDHYKKMTNRTYVVIAIATVLIIGAGVYFYVSQEDVAMVGGDRDEYGCLLAAGYAFNGEIGACIRAFELTPDIMQAAQLAVNKVGRGYALTVVSFNSYEEAGSYDIILERGAEREEETVYIRNGEVQIQE